APILSADAAPVLALAVEIADELESAGVEYVAGDAVEGINPAHDMCRLLINAALVRIECRSARRLANFEFLVEGPPQECPAEDRPDAILVKLDGAAYERKLEAVRAHPDLAVDVERILANYGQEPFRVECLRPVRY